MVRYIRPDKLTGLKITHSHPVLNRGDRIVVLNVAHSVDVWLTDSVRLCVTYEGNPMILSNQISPDQTTKTRTDLHDQSYAEKE